MSRPGIPACVPNFARRSLNDIWMAVIVIGVVGAWIDVEFYRLARLLQRFDHALGFVELHCPIGVAVMHEKRALKLRAH